MNDSPPSAAPIKVLYVNHTSRLGGGELALLNLVKNLDRSVVAPEVALLSAGPLADRLTSLNVPVHIIPLPENVLEARKDTLGPRALLKAGAVLHSLQAARKLARLIRRLEPDIVHTNSLKADILGGLAGRIARVPVVWHVRDRIEEDYLPRPVVRVFRLLAKWVPQWVIANSAATMQTLHLPPGKPRTVVPSGLAPDEIYPDPSPVDPAAPLTQVGLIGRITRWKGQDVFIRAAALVRERFPEARFHIIGSALFGEEDYEAEIRKLTEDLGLDDVINFQGYRNDIAQALRELDILVHASTTGEPFGQVVVQGLAAAKPVVATSGGAIPEIVEHEKTGLLVPMADHRAMAEAILRFMADPAAAREMAGRGPERVRTHFTIKITVQLVSGVYCSMIGRR